MKQDNKVWKDYNLAKKAYESNKFGDALQYLARYKGNLNLFWHNYLILSINEKINKIESSLELIDHLIKQSNNEIKISPNKKGLLYYRQSCFYNLVDNKNLSIRSCIYALNELPDFQRFKDHLLLLFKKYNIEEKIISIFKERNVLECDFLSKYIKKVGQWKILRLSEDCAEYKLIRIDDKKQVVIDCPEVNSLNKHYKFRSKLIQKQAYIVEVPNGKAWGNGKSNLITTKNGNPIAGISKGAFTIKNSFLDSNPKLLRGKVALLSSNFSRGNYAHWLLDTLPRIKLLQLHFENLNDIDHFVFHKVTSDFHEESFQELGIQDKVVTTLDYPLIQAEYLYVPSLVSHPLNCGSKWAIDFVRSLFIKEHIAKKNSKKLYLNRSNATKRKIINEGEVINFLNSHGFVNVSMENLSSVKEEAIMMQQAEIIISCHGAGLANIVFCNPGTKVIEILPPLYGTCSFQVLSTILKLEYSYLKGYSLEEKIVPLKRKPEDGKKNFYVDIKALEEILK